MQAYRQFHYLPYLQMFDDIARVLRVYAPKIVPTIVTITDEDLAWFRKPLRGL